MPLCVLADVSVLPIVDPVFALDLLAQSGQVEDVVSNARAITHRLHCGTLGFQDADRTKGA